MKTTKPTARDSRNKAAAQAEAALQARRDQLGGLGLRVTSNRLKVLAAIQAADQALSHADLELALQQSIDAVTLYRTLETFVEAGLVSRSVGSDRVNRFALNQGEGASHHEHAHFHCDRCGRVFCLPAKAPRRPAVPEGFAVAGVDLIVHGNCASCGDA